MDGKDAEEITEKPARDKGTSSRWKLSVGVSVKPAYSICVPVRIPAAPSWNSTLQPPHSPCSLSLDLRPGFLFLYP